MKLVILICLIMSLPSFGKGLVRGECYYLAKESYSTSTIYNFIEKTKRYNWGYCYTRDLGLRVCKMWGEEKLYSKIECPRQLSLIYTLP